jgi:hypothetical protein
MARKRSKERNESYLKWLFSIILLSMLFFSLKYNFIYKVYEFNHIIFTLVVLFIATVPLYIYTKKFKLASVYMLFIAYLVFLCF